MNQGDLLARFLAYLHRGGSWAYWWILEGKYAEAEPLLDESLAIREKVVGTSHPDYGSALTLKAIVQLEEKRYQEALETAEKAEKILKENFPADHWRVAMAENVVGSALAGLGRYEEAEPLMLESNKILADAPMPGVAERSRERLAKLYSDWGKNELALRFRDSQ